MKKMFKNFLSKWPMGLFICTISFVVYSCVKPSSEELFPAASSATCSDGFLNQGEYYVDCGGPCEPCATGLPSVSFQADSTWLPDNPSNFPVNSDFAAVGFLNKRIYISAIDTFNKFIEQISISFSFPDSFKLGVYEVNQPTTQEYYFHNPPFTSPGQVPLDYGIVTITNRDSVNNLISGEFKYTCKPDPLTGYRVAIYNGFFKDIPTVPPLP